MCIVHCAYVKGLKGQWHDQSVHTGSGRDIFRFTGGFGDSFCIFTIQNFDIHLKYFISRCKSCFLSFYLVLRFEN